MRLKDYNERDGKRVWLSEGEMQRLLANADADNFNAEVSLLLAGRCGLRREEIVDVTPADVVRTDHGDVVRVWEGKGSKYREVPAPDRLITLLRGVAIEPDEAIVDVAPSTIYDYVERARARCRVETGDDGWQYVGPHDLRRSWAILLLERGVLPAVVMEWGGWDSWRTFRDHYLSEFSPAALRRERGKIDWYGGRSSSSRSSSSPADSYAAIEPDTDRY